MISLGALYSNEQLRIETLFIIIRRSSRMQRRPTCYCKKAPILDREYRRMRGKRFTLGRFFHFPSKGSMEFFDSLGNPPEHYHRRFQSILIFNGPRYKYIDSRIQSVTSSLCGHYCIYFILQRIKGRSMNNIVHDFYDLNTHANDRLVSDFINDMY